MTPLYFRFAFAINGVELVTTVAWSQSNAVDATPFLTDVLRHSLIDTAVTPDTIYQDVKDRAGEVRRGLGLYQDVMDRFGGSQGVWVATP